VGTSADEYAYIGLKSSKIYHSLSILNLKLLKPNDLMAVKNPKSGHPKILHLEGGLQQTISNI
jgi:hypothetical protein